MSSSTEKIKIDPALATSVGFTAGRLHVALSDGREISVPIDRFPRLVNATAQARNHWEITSFGTAIRWPDIDEDIGVGTLLGVPEWLVEQAAGFEIHDLR